MRMFIVTATLLLGIGTGWAAEAPPASEREGRPFLPEARLDVPAPADADAQRLLFLQGATLARRSTPTELRLEMTMAPPTERNLSHLLYRPTQPANRFESALFGLGAAANCAGFLGVLGEFAGVWDEKTAWGVLAAGAAAGALWGGTLGNGKVRVEVGVQDRDEP